jgi:hypothetical protein
MASSINVNNPVEGSATTASVRTNFSAAKTEIEALQTDKFDKTITANNVLIGNDNGASQAAQELDATAVLAILGVEAGATADQTDAEIRAAVEAATDSNVFTDNDHSKLDGIEDSATADQTTEEIQDAAWGGTTLTGTQTGITVTYDDDNNNVDFEHDAHTGDVTGSTALTIANNAVTLAKMDQIATDSFLGRDTAATGNVEVLSAATARSILGIEAGATADQTDGEIETAYNNQVAQVSQAEAEAGAVTSDRRWTPERVKQAINANDAASVDGYSIWTGTQASYDGIGTPDSNTLYFTTT